MTSLHAAVALLVGLLLPAYSWTDGSGWLAWTMFAKSGTYRLTVRVLDSGGVTHGINPTDLTRFMSGDAATFLSGADQFRHAPVAAALRRNLVGLAALGCRTLPGARHAWVALETRANLDASVVTSRAETSCLAEVGVN